MTPAPSDHLLRTLAAVPPGARVLDLGCGAGRHTEPVARLGFDVWAVDPDGAHVEAARARLAAVVGADEAARRATRGGLDALGYPDAYADWAVMAPVPDEAGARAAALAEAARTLRPGGWIWVEAPSEDGLVAAAERAGLVIAEEPAEDAGAVHAVFRRPGAVR